MNFSRLLSLIVVNLYTKSFRQKQKRQLFKTNNKGPKKVWIPKEFVISFVGETNKRIKIVGDLHIKEGRSS